jgi:hypothetical protein
MKVIILLFFLFILNTEIVNPPPIFKREELEKMDHDELSDLLYQRDIKCDNCIGSYDYIEKIHLVKTVLDFQHLPYIKELKTKPKPKFPAPPNPYILLLN